MYVYIPMVFRTPSHIHTQTNKNNNNNILFSLFPDFIIIFHFRNWVGNGIFTYSHRVFFSLSLFLSPSLLRSLFSSRIQRQQRQQSSKCDNNRLATSKEDLIKKFFFNQPIKTFENFCEYKMLDLICKRKKKFRCEVPSIIIHTYTNKRKTYSYCVRVRKGILFFSHWFFNFREVFNMLLALKWQKYFLFVLERFSLISFIFLPKILLLIFCSEQISWMNARKKKKLKAFWIYSMNKTEFDDEHKRHTPPL